MKIIFDKIMEYVLKLLNKELFEVKEDLINNTLKSNEKYHNWINKQVLHPFVFVYEYDYQCQQIQKHIACISII